MANEHITDQMTKIVETLMTSWQSDYYKYDKPTIEKATIENFPKLWIVGESHTFMLDLSAYKEMFNTEEYIRYCYAQGDDTFSAWIDHVGADKIFHITEFGVHQIGIPMARQIISETVEPVVKAWESEHGKLPTNFKVQVFFDFTSTSEVIALIRDCEAHNDDSLIRILRRFRKRRKCASDHHIIVKYLREFNEFKYEEIYNGETMMEGGIVFHGWPETGYMTNGSIQLTPQYGWDHHS